MCYPLCAPFQHVHPNVLTLVALMVGLACAATAAHGPHHTGWACVLWAVNRVLDGLDGCVARRFNKQSDFGGYLDIVCDFVVYGFIPIGLVVGHPDPAHWLTLAVLESIYFVNAAGLFCLSAILERYQAGAAASSELTSITMPTGLIEGTETIIMYTVFILWPQHLTIWCGSISPLFFFSVSCVCLTVFSKSFSHFHSCAMLRPTCVITIHKCYCFVRGKCVSAISAATLCVLRQCAWCVC